MTDSLKAFRLLVEALDVWGFEVSEDKQGFVNKHTGKRLACTWAEEPISEPEQGKLIVGFFSSVLVDAYREMVRGRRYVKYTLSPVETVPPTAMVGEHQAIDLAPGLDKKYAIAIDVGDMPTKEALEHLNLVRPQIKAFLEDAQFLIIPMRNGVPSVKFYKLEQMPVASPSSCEGNPYAHADLDAGDICPYCGVMVS